METENEVQVKPRQHKLLDRPVPGMILMILWALFFSEVLFGMIGGILDGMVQMSLRLASGIPQEEIGSAAGQMKTGTITYCFCALGGFLVLLIHRRYFRGEFRGYLPRIASDDRRSMLAAGAVIAIDLGYCLAGDISNGFKVPGTEALAIALMAGFCEEAAFRGLALSTAMRTVKDQRGITRAVLLTAILFGLVHGSNVLAGADPTGTLVQVLFTVGMGVFMAALYLRTGNLATALLFHILHDILAQCTQVSEGAIVTQMSPLSIAENLGMTLILAAGGIFLLKGHTEEILAVWRERWSREEAGSSPAES